MGSVNLELRRPIGEEALVGSGPPEALPFTVMCASQATERSPHRVLNPVVSGAGGPVAPGCVHVTMRGTDTRVPTLVIESGPE